MQALGTVKASIAASTYGYTTQQIQAICAEAASAATDILYARSGRVFTGVCGPVTVRPVARPAGIDQRAWLGGGGAWGLGSAWGAVSWYGLGTGGVVSHFGTSDAPPEVPLGNYPVLDLVQVKIDGVIIPTDEYELRDYRTLVRLRPNASATPTERWGWPTSQVGDLPDTEPGTFSVTYTYGQDPGSGGRLACKKMAELLALPSFGVQSHLPTRVTSIQRQGVSAAVADVEDLLSKGLLGIYEVDSWLETVNPTHASRQSVVWSPDLGRPRRQATPSTS